MIRILGLILSLSLASCGDLFMKASKEVEVGLKQFAGCELDTEAFSYILEKNIKGDLECLEEKLGLFIDAVRTDRPGFISRNVLKDFILRGPMEIDPDVVDIVDALFDLSYLVQGGDKDYLSKGKLSELFELTKYFNARIWKIYKYFRSEDEVNYSRHLREREIVFNELTLIANKAREIFKTNRGHVDQIDTELLISNLLSRNSSTVEMIRSLMFLKRAFLGGSIFQLTDTEFDNLLNIIPDLAQVAFDAVKFNKYNFMDKEQTLVQILKNDLRIIDRNIYKGFGENEAIFDVADLINAISVNIGEIMGIDVTKYLREVTRAKAIILQGELNSEFNYHELKQFVAEVDSVLFDAGMYYRIYNYFRDELDANTPVTVDFSEFPAMNSDEQEVVADFARVATTYRFIKGSFKTPFYSHDYGRNPNAFIEVLGLEYLVKKVMMTYGRENDRARGGYDMTLDHTTDLIYDYKWLLKDLGIITIGRKKGQEIQGIANNFVLMSTLFQNQSDGCSSDTVCVETPEITEFLIGVVTAMAVKDFFTDTMIEFCSDHLDEHDRIAPSCFRNNFLNVIEEPIPGDGRSLADYMPLFHQYLKELVADVPEGEEPISSKAYLKFLFETESFTRSCMYYDDAKTDEVYLKGRDAFAVFAGLLNVEATVLRFDTNKNNIMDGVRGNEIRYAYNNVYKGAIKALIDPDGGFMTKLSWPIFQYLIKYGEVPEPSQFRSVWKFVKFLLKRNKRADATRTTVSNILKTIGEQAGEPGNEYKCEECFRDPTVECLPADDQWND